MNRIPLLTAALLLGGCATTYDITLMPRDSGKLYSGVLEDVGRSEGRISVKLEDRSYVGTWVQVTAGRTTGYTTGGAWSGRGWGGWGWGGGYVSVENPEGATATALLQSPDGAGLRCQLRGIYGTGGGRCQDDKGREYDVQLRAKAPT